MCKQACITDLTGISLSKRALETIKDIITSNRNDDGFGYSVAGQGKLFSEKTQDVEGWKAYTPASKIHVAMPPAFTRTPAGWQKGTFPKEPKSIIIHGRFSTNTKTLQNTHPFVTASNTCAMIHNGVVHDEGLVPIKTTTNNDSEIIFRYHLAGGVDKVTANVSGYYSYMFLHSNNKLEIVRDDTANLFWAPLENKGMIFATASGDIPLICEALNVKHGRIYEVPINVYVLFKDGKFMTYRTITPLEPKAQTGYNKWKQGHAVAPVYEEVVYDGSKYKHFPSDETYLEDVFCEDIIGDGISIKTIAVAAGLSEQEVGSRLAGYVKGETVGQMFAKELADMEMKQAI